jgi:hypothetical protein
MCKSNGIVVVRTSTFQELILKHVASTPAAVVRMNLQTIEMVVTAIPRDANEIMRFYGKSSRLYRFE